MKIMDVAVRTSAVLAFACVALGASVANAEHCDDVVQPASCHRVNPTADITFDEGSDIPALIDTVLFWEGDSARREARELEPGADVSKPGLEIRLGAGGWGTGGQEPFVLARSSFSHLLAWQARWFIPLNLSIGEQWGQDCQPGTSLCYSNAGLDFFWDIANAELYRMVRITKTNPAPLPAGVTHVPVLVDYRIGIYADGSIVQNGDMRYAAVGGTASVSIGYYDSQYRSKRVLCNNTVEDGQHGLECRDTDLIEGVEGREHSGTLSHQVPLARLGAIQLRIIALSWPDLSPACVERETTFGTMCVVDPLVGAGHTVVDPFVYIDPSWAYASWFKLEIAADETDTTWATPVRRAPFDLETLMPIAEGTAVSILATGTVTAMAIPATAMEMAIPEMATVTATATVTSATATATATVTSAMATARPAMAMAMATPETVTAMEIATTPVRVATHRPMNPAEATAAAAAASVPARHRKAPLAGSSPWPRS